MELTMLIVIELGIVFTLSIDWPKTDLNASKVERDLYTHDDALCSGCRETMYIGKGGYNDDNYFENVYKNPKEHTCKCGAIYWHRWTRSGVIVVRIK